jgi:hypothetical protein
MVKSFYCIFVVFAFACCSQVAVENPTDKFQEGKKLSKLESDKMGEISGGAASVNNSGFFWLHNDSGNAAELYLVDESLNILLTCTLPVDNRDWEDMAVGPGPEKGKYYVYIGDIGDNDSKHEKKYIYRFQEPVWDKETRKLAITQFDTITFKLEGKKKDTETILLDPSTNDLFIISKRDDPVWVYQLKYPYSTDSTIVAKKAFALPFTQIVGGDVSPDGKKLLLKNYEHVFYWEMTSAIPFAELMQQKPYEIPYEREPQGETIMWARDQSGFYTVSEKNVGKSSYLYLYKQKNLKR